tara:strand:+ start:638 stop:940 length:303 start_codon:yes stop_codon:yes gene_type:complete
MEDIVVQISASALSDHMNRLYWDSGIARETSDGWLCDHIDLEGATITMVKDGNRSCVVSLTRPALIEFIDDMAYQVEFAEGAPAYTAMCKRTLAKLREVV